jgi:hypothetical protein
VKVTKKTKRVVVDKTEELKLTPAVNKTTASASRSSEISDKSSQSEKLKKGLSPVIPNPTPVTEHGESSTMEASESLALTPELLLAAYGVFMRQQEL